MCCLNVEIVGGGAAGGGEGGWDTGIIYFKISCNGFDSMRNFLIDAKISTMASLHENMNF